LRGENRGKPGEGILHIVNIPWFSGLGSYALDMGFYMRELGFNVSFAAPGGSTLCGILEKEFKVIPVPGRDPLQTLRGALKLARRAGDFDMVVSHSGSSFFAASVMKLFNRNLILMRVRAEKGSPKKNIFNRILHRFGDGVIVATERMKREFSAAGCAPGRVFVLPPPVDTEKFYYTDPPGNKTVAIVGRLSPVKGHRVLIEAIPRIKELTGSLKVIFAGRESKTDYKTLLRQAEELGVSGDIEYRGALSPGEVGALMRGSDAGIIASLGSEEVSRAALEWIASGRAVISSRVGCLDEFLGGTGAAFMYEKGDSVELGEKTARLLNDRPLCVETGKRARRLAEERFSPGVYMEKLREIVKILR